MIPPTPGLDRRELLRLLGSGTILGGAFAAGLVASPAGAATNPYRPVRQFRAMWLSSVVNIDWPSRTGLGVEALKAEFVAWLDLAVALRLNAVICQIRPTADAFWPSSYEPWSQYLTGVQGRDPGFDPVAFCLAECRKRNLEYHAWFNPYRVSMQTDPGRLVPDHPARRHPDWVFAYGGKLYYDPGQPQVRAFVQRAMLDAVRRYDIDAVHFDDYFYPYPVGGQAYPDAATYARHGRGFGTVEDWRRDNIDLLIQEMGQQVHALKPWVKFGVSPFGIWRNIASDPRGSQTSGTESYSAISADTRRWVRQRWVDYINPQIYWQIGLPVADYATLVAWWAEVVRGTGVGLYIGQAAYKMTSGVFTDPAELSNHLRLAHEHPEIEGDVWFSAKDVRTDAAGAVSLMAQQHYSRPALVPVIDSLGGQAPTAPRLISARRTAAGVQVRWLAGSGPVPASYAVWRVPRAIDLDRPAQIGTALGDATHLVATVRADPRPLQVWVDPAPAIEGVHYLITGYDRLWHQSPPSQPLRL